METTDWDSYGTGRYEKCANCMAHCGYEPTAADAAIRHPFKTPHGGAARPRTEGPMAPEISLANQRPARIPVRAPRRDDAVGSQGQAEVHVRRGESADPRGLSDHATP